MTIVADTSAIIALIDTDEAPHKQVRELYALTRKDWVLPAAILPELDYHIAKRLGAAFYQAWLADLNAGAYRIAWNDAPDLTCALALHSRYADLGMGLVDSLVMATAERLHAAAIVTLDLRHFAAVQLTSNPRLWPRDA